MKNTTDRPTTVTTIWRDGTVTRPTPQGQIVALKPIEPVREKTENPKP